MTALASSGTITVQADQPGVQISSNLFGIFFEEINSAGDGGIYAELVRNRSFEDASTPVYWTLVTSGGAGGTMTLDTSLPLSATNLHSLKLAQIGTGAAGVANSGFWGIPLSQGATYNLGFYARASLGYSGSITASLESSSGSTVYAQAIFPGLTTSWQHFAASLSPNSTDPSARLVLRIAQAGTVWLDFVSLFPAQTYNQRTNGMRPDLMNMLTGLRPSFIRFPGGSWIDGNSISNAYHWEPTVGPPPDRMERTNLWGYMVSNGQGFHEYLQMCEDLGAAPLFVVNCGMDVSQNAVPTNQLSSWVQEVLDAIQYANGATNTPMGAQRAANGHPAPFNLQYIEIGNENNGSAYNDHYTIFYDGIKAQYPQLHLIADSFGTIPSSRPVEIMDEHYYSDPGFFEANATRYDTYSRAGPKVYVGEYAVTSGAGNGNLAGALGEAAFMTGLERNSDVVLMASYAPLFANLNNKDWNPDLIYFNGTQTYGTPSYYAQQMFSLNRGDVVLPTQTISGTSGLPKYGSIGLSTWNTQAAFSNLVVTANGQTVYQSDFTQGSPGWQIMSGSWSTVNGVFQQTAGGTDERAVLTSGPWTNVTYTLKALKLSGSEGFLIMFHVADANDWTWWNIGGWNNTQHAIERMDDGLKAIISPAVPASVVLNHWYDVRIEVNGSEIKCYLDGQLIHDVSYAATKHGGIGLGTWNTQSEYTNLNVSALGQTLYQSDFVNQGTTGWQVLSGSWSVTNGSYAQLAQGIDERSVTGSTNWSDYTYTLQAQKLGGAEGFLVIFNYQDPNNFTWWNIGGWNNTQHAIERTENGAKYMVGSPVPGSVTTGQWYNIRIVVGGARIQCYLNGTLIHDVADPIPQPLYASASLSTNFGQLILKTVNVSSQPLPTQLNLNGTLGLAPNAGLVQLTSANASDENSLTQPALVFPATNTLANITTNMVYTFPANSLTIMRLQLPPSSPIIVSLGTGANQIDPTTLPGIPVQLNSFITNTVSVSYVIETANGFTTNGTLNFVPGQTSTNISWPPGLIQPGVLVRITLEQPVNAQLGTPIRSYFAQPYTNGAPLILNLARFSDETLAYWTDTNASLVSANNLTGSWSPVANAPSPIHIPSSNTGRTFYRLKK